jgi:hypothetical protein
MGRRSGKEFLDGNPLAAEQELASGLRKACGGFRAREALAVAATLHLDGRDGLFALQPEIHFPVSASAPLNPTV